MSVTGLLPIDPVVAVREARTEAEWGAVRAIRQAVFIDEQACPPEEEWDEHDAPEARGGPTHHLLGTLNGLPVGCARWRRVEAYAKLERFAVLAAARGRGVGRALVARALTDARNKGLRRFVLHAQTHATGLYAPFGFEIVGEPFSEAGIEHVKMTLTDR